MASFAGGLGQTTVLAASGVSLEDVPAELVFVPTASGDVELDWKLNVQTTDRLHWYDTVVSATDGDVVYVSDWVDSASYNVFGLPLENPDDGPRSLEVDPQDAIASPFGWHDTNGAAGAEFTDTRGNNVYAQEDRLATDSGNGARPDGGSTLDFDFPIDFAQSPLSYQDAAVTNLFYWNNVLHDVHYRYGFDEAAGNFQVNNYGNGGMGEGWSDFWSLSFAQKPADGKMDAYPVGTYVLGQPSTGPGIRRYAYSFDMALDPLTYGDFNTSSEVHDAGEIWCSALWDLNWLLIDAYGFDPDLYGGSGGNNLAMQLVMDGLKLQPASPSFLEGRDAILLADLTLTGGANNSAIWTAFARRGMGFSADDGGSGDATTVTAAFDMPAAKPGSQSFIHPSRFESFTLDAGMLQATLAKAPLEFSFEAAQALPVITLPTPESGFARFEIVESPIMAPALAAKYPQIKTYRGQGIDDPAATIRFDVTPAGFHAQVLSPSGTYYIDPYWHLDTSLYISYKKQDYLPDPNSAFREEVLEAGIGRLVARDDAVGQLNLAPSGSELRTYRLAVAATGEYTAFHGGIVTYTTTGAGNAAAVITSTGNNIPTVGAGGDFTIPNTAVTWTGGTTETVTWGAAIATDKQALLPGQTATFANYTSYHRGINGIMVDILGLADPIAVADDDFSEFAFMVGNSNDPTEWLPAEDDVCYVGSSIGENTGDFKVDYDDAFNNIWPSLFTPSPIGVDHVADVTRDGRIDYYDVFVGVWPNLFAPAPLKQITVPATPSLPASTDFVFDENLPWAIELMWFDALYGSSSDSAEEEDDALEATAVDGVFSVYYEE